MSSEPVDEWTAAKKFVLGAGVALWFCGYYVVAALVRGWPLPF